MLVRPFLGREQRDVLRLDIAVQKTCRVRRDVDPDPDVNSDADAKPAAGPPLAALHGCTTNNNSLLICYIFS